MCIGGSTNTVLHLPAIAKEYGIDIDLDLFDKISRKTPNLTKILPSGPHMLEDLDAAGGIPAVLNRIVKLLHGDQQTVNGKSLGEIAAAGKVKDDAIIKPLLNRIQRRAASPSCGATSARAVRSSGSRASPRR
jgi:dihydroxy-acid dehydratase